jgi:hypothetical protein
MILKEPINVMHKKTQKPYKIIGFVVDCTNVSNDEIMVLYKHFNTNEKADFVRTWTEFVDKFDVKVNDFYEIFNEIQEIYTHSKVTSNKPKMPKLETFEEIRNYIINSYK